MSIFGAVASAVVGKAVSQIFGGDGKDGGVQQVTYTTPPKPTEPTGLLAKSVMSGRQATLTPSQLRTAFRGTAPEGAPKGLKSAPPAFVSSQTAFWASIIDRAINQAQATLPASSKEQHGIFRR